MKKILIDLAVLVSLCSNLNASLFFTSDDGNYMLDNRYFCTYDIDTVTGRVIPKIWVEIYIKKEDIRAVVNLDMVARNTVVFNEKIRKLKTKPLLTYSQKEELKRYESTSKFFTVI
ncbi:MAG: hypothetical protein LBT96_02935 [Campylobacteraceae bacterium]|jgi:hypothetical protein|nr:hypothetical protein [Campylobacteraceae bacterium]